MGDQESGLTQLRTLEERLQDWLSSQGGQLQSLARQFQQQAGDMWQEFEKRIQALDDARQALEDRIGRQLDDLLTQQRSLARRLQAMTVEAAPSRAKTPVRKTASKTPTTRKAGKRSTATRPAARKSGSKTKATKRSTAKRSTKRSTAKRS